MITVLLADLYTTTQTTYNYYIANRWFTDSLLSIQLAIAIANILCIASYYSYHVKYIEDVLPNQTCPCQDGQGRID